MTVADYELSSNHEQPPEPVPPPLCKPQPTGITVTVRRVVRTAPYESAEVVLSLTADPDPHYSARQNIQRVYDLLSDRVEAYIGEMRINAISSSPTD